MATRIAITDKRLDDRREAIRLDEENKAFREFVEVVAMSSGAFRMRARALLIKWAKPEGTS